MKVFHKRILKHQLHDALWYWVYIPSAVIGGGMLIDFAARLPRFNRHTVISVLAVLLIIPGSVLIFRSMRNLEVPGHGTANSKAPPRLLVTAGCYALCRHPMFLGYDMAAFGILLLIGLPEALFVAYPAMILLESRFLRQKAFRRAIQELQELHAVSVALHQKVRKRFHRIEGVSLIENPVLAFQ